MDGLGLGPDKNNPFYTPPSMSELILRTLGQAVPPPGRLRVPNGVGGQLLGAAIRVGGGLAGNIGDEQLRQRLDPLARQLAINQQAAQAAQGISVPVSPAQTLPLEGPRQESGQYFSQQDAPATLMTPAVTRLPISLPELLANAPDIKTKNKIIAGITAGKFPGEALVGNPMLPAQLEHIRLQNEQLIPAQVAASKANTALHLAQAADTGGIAAQNLASKVAIKLALNPDDPVALREMELLKEMRTNPQGPESRTYDYLVKKYDGDMEKVLAEYPKVLREFRTAAGAGTEQGRVDVRNTPEARSGAANVATGTATGTGTARIEVAQNAPLDLNANKWVDPKTLRYAPADYTLKQAKDAGYVAVSPSLSAAIPSARTALQTLDKYDELSKQLLVSRGKGTAADIARIQSNRASLQARRLAGDPVVIDFDAMSSTIATQVKAFGDTGNIAIKEQEFQGRALPNTQDSLESALQKTKSRRQMLEAVIRSSVGTPAASRGPSNIPARLPPPPVSSLPPGWEIVQ